MSIPAILNRRVDAEANEGFGGYACIDVDSKEEALRVAREFMERRVHWPAFEGE